MKYKAKIGLIVLISKIWLHIDILFLAYKTTQKAKYPLIYSNNPTIIATFVVSILVYIDIILERTLLIVPTL